MSKDEIDFNDLLNSIKGTKLHALLLKNRYILKKYGLLLVFVAFASAVAWHFYKVGQPSLFQTTFLVKNHQLNSKLAELITLKFNHHIDTNKAFSHVQNVSFFKEQDNFDWFQKIDLYEKVAPTDVRNWIVFQETITLNVISKVQLSNNFKVELISFFNNHPYLKNQLSRENEFLNQKINLVNQQIEALDPQENAFKILELNIKKADLEYARSNLPSTEVLYQSAPSKVKPYAKLELPLSAFAGLFIVLALLNVFVKPSN
jgi:hypothetical protein